MSDPCYRCHKEQPTKSEENLAVLGKFKDETSAKEIQEVIGLRGMMYSPKKKIKPEKVKPHPYYSCPCGLILQYNCFGKHRQSFHHKKYEKDSGIAFNKKNINEWAIPCTEEDFMRQKAEHKEKVLKFYESIKK